MLQLQHIKKTFSQILAEAFGSQLRRNMTSGFLTTAINMLAILVSYPLYLRFLGYEKYGLWLIFTTVLTFAQLGNLGINQAVMKLVAEEHGRNNLQGIRSYVTMAWTTLTITGSAVFLIILIFKVNIINLFKLSDDIAKLASWLLPYVGALTIYVFIVQSLNAALAGLGRMDLSNYILSSGQVSAVVISVLLLGLGRGIESLLIGYTSSFIVVHIASLLFIRRQVKLGFLRQDNWDIQRLKKLISFSSGVFGGTLMSMLMDPFNKLMLSRYSGVATIPVYDIAFRGSMQVRGLMEAGVRAIMPEVSRIGANMTLQAHSRINQINRRTMRLILFYGAPLFVILFIFAHFLLKFWLRDNFVDALPTVFRILLFGTFLSLIGVPAYYTLLGLGKVRYCFFSFIIQGIANALILTAIALINGAISEKIVAFAVMFSMGITNTYLLWQKYHLMHNKLIEIQNNNTVDFIENTSSFYRS